MPLNVYIRGFIGTITKLDFGWEKNRFIRSYFIFVTGAIATTANLLFTILADSASFCLSKEVAASNKKLRHIKPKTS